MTERPTKTIVTPITQAQIVVKEWITGREYEMSQKPVLEGYKMGKDGHSEIAGTVIQELNHKALEAYVVSVNGSTDKVVDAILDLPNDDYQFVIDSVNAVSKKK
jgi:hypothetical protein